MENLIRIVETDVDGCGGTAEMFATCSEPVTKEITDKLGEILLTVKYEVASDDWDTEAMVEEAINRFNSEQTWEKTGKLLDNPQLTLVGSPVAAEVEF